MRPLTVFVGPSNTGKSYLAILVYALHRVFGGSGFRTYGRRPGYWFGASGIRPIKLNKAARASLAAWLSSLPETESAPPLPPEVAANLRPALERPRGFARNLEAEMLRCFGTEAREELVRRPGTQTSARVGLHLPQEISRPPVKYEFMFGRGTTQFSGHIADESIAIESVPPEYLEEIAFGFRGRLDQADLLDREQTHAVRLLLDALFSSLVRPLTPGAFYLPASRTGVMHSHQALVSALIQSAATAGLRRSPEIPTLSGVLADFLQQLIGMPQRRRGGPLGEFAEHLEDRVLDGAVRQDRGDTDYPTFSYRPRGWKDDLPLMQTSSMVSELAPVVLYLRHLVLSGNVLIIEEPEAHLHPAMQAAFARELAGLVHAGVRIILTTHSEWFVEQISNLVRLSELPEDRRADIAGGDVALTSDQIGVWLFRSKGRPKGSVVDEVKFDRETGLFPAGYDAVSEALYNEGATIFNRLQEDAGE